MQKLICLVGPTAIGKTKTAIELAKIFDCEIVSGDSMQVYSELSIGTAAPTAAEQSQVPHHLVHCQSVFEPYDVHDFVEQAQREINKIEAKDKLPLLAGGTGFYAKALLYDLALGGKQEETNDPALEEELQEKGPQAMWDKLNKLDPNAAAKIPWQNARRTLRALTVIKQTGQPFSQQQKEVKPRYDFLVLGLNTDRALLYERINQRVDVMMEQGLLKEAQFVFDNRGRIYQAKQAIGYKEFFPYFEKKTELTTCVEKLKQSSRRYAKRQLTYFRHQLPVRWFDPLQDPAYLSKMAQVVKNWLNSARPV
jgi:tRNA dimethylallyltransferase